MLKGDFHTQAQTSPELPVQILVNYWEFRPARLAAHLDELIRKGVQQVASFVPWQALESDISHSFSRFTQACVERRLKLTLFPAPELGMHYPSAGIPKDVLARPENRALDAEGNPIICFSPPNAFQLPSLFSPDVSKRYFGFLAKFDSCLADVAKQAPGVSELVTVRLGAGFWKYYRGAFRPRTGVQAVDAYRGTAGDFSSTASLSYRQSLEQVYGQPEYADPTPLSAARWKTRELEELNRRSFFQRSEEVFRNRSAQQLGRRCPTLSIEEVEVYTPEVDPSLTESYTLQVLAGGSGDFRAIDRVLEEGLQRQALTSTIKGSAREAKPWVHWSSIGQFRSLAESERQFLILKSLLLAGARGGGLIIPDEEWFVLSSAFRSRVESFGRLIGAGALKLKDVAEVWVPHLWSLGSHEGIASGPAEGGDQLWSSLEAQLGPRSRVCAGVGGLRASEDLKLVILDPSMPVTVDLAEHLLNWVGSTNHPGRVVALPDGALITESAKQFLDKNLDRSGSLDVSLGISFELCQFGSGKWVSYQVPQTSRGALLADGQGKSTWQAFVQALISLAEIPSYCQSSEDPIDLIPLEGRQDVLALFALNASSNCVSTQIRFPKVVAVSDLTLAIASAGLGSAPARADAAAVPADRFSLDVPPCGVLPLAVDGLELRRPTEIDRCGLSSELMRKVDAVQQEGQWS